MDDDYKPNEILDISERKIYSLTDIIIPSHVKVLKCQKCNLKDLDGLPKQIEVLDCSFNGIKKVSLFNHIKLDSLTCDYNQIKRFHPGDLPKNLRVLSCVANKLKTLEGLSSKIRDLDVSDNYLRSFKGIPDVYTCTCTLNYIESLLYLQGGICELRCSFNPINIKEHRPKSLKKIYCKR
jgi:Leucine-rich repeat (LRR) protein